MQCASCGRRKGRRTCPALGGRAICPSCCGTKRLVELPCPDHCVHLAAAREHPAAVVRRQQEDDVAVLLPSIAHLTERQYELYFLFHGVVARHEPEGFARLHDEDVADAAGAVAATLETAARGVLYEHTPAALPAQRLAREITARLADVRSHGVTVYDGEAAIALRAMERAARETRLKRPGEDAYLALMTRLIQVERSQAALSEAPASSIIVP